MNLAGIFVIAVSIEFSLGNQVKFEDNFNGQSLDESKWKVEQTLAGGHDWQFQWFVNDKENLYTSNGILNIKPTLTADKFSEEDLYKKEIEIDNQVCTQSHNFGCSRKGSRSHILNPVRSASIETKDGFRFGVIEIKAKLPAGDWLRPTIKLMPKDNVYGPWPKSGQIVLIEARGNRNLHDVDEESHGIDRMTTTVHYGPSYDLNAWENMHFTAESPEGFHDKFHVFKFDWSKKGMKFFVDEKHYGNFSIAKDGSFWKKGEFADSALENPWAGGSSMAPFDQKFSISIGLAVGGVSGYFSDDWENRPDVKPWKDSSQKAALFFWKGKDKWFKTWTLSSDSANFQIDYVKIISQ